MKKTILALLFLVLSSAPVEAFTSSPTGGGGHTIEDEGSALTQRSVLNFTGDGVACSDDAVNSETDCLITSLGAPAANYYVKGGSSVAILQNLGTSATSGWQTSGCPQGGNCVELDGTDDYIILPLHMINQSAGTIVIWFTCETTAWNSIAQTSARIFGTDHSSGNHSEIRTYRQTDNGLEIYYGTGGSSPFLDLGTPNQSTANFMVFSWGASTVKGYLNSGTVADSDVYGSGMIQPNLDFSVGRWRSGPVYGPFKIDAVRIYDIQLSDTDVGNLYNAGAGRNCSYSLSDNNLLGCFDFEENEGKIAAGSEPVPTGWNASDSNDCQSSSNPCLTLQGAMNKIPKVATGSTTVNVASGYYDHAPGGNLNSMLYLDHIATGTNRISIIGYNNPQKGQFAHAQSDPGDVTHYISDGTATADYPLDGTNGLGQAKITDSAMSLDNDGRFNSALIRFVGGTGYVSTAGQDWKNWYRVEDHTAGTVDVIGQWRGSTPVTVQFEFYAWQYAPMLDANGASYCIALVGARGFIIEGIGCNRETNVSTEASNLHPGTVEAGIYQLGTFDIQFRMIYAKYGRFFQSHYSFETSVFDSAETGGEVRDFNGQAWFKYTRFTEFDEKGFYGNGSTVRIENSHFLTSLTGSAAASVNLESQSHGLVIRDNKIFGKNVAGSKSLYVIDSSRAFLNGENYIDCGSTGALTYGIFVFNSTSLEVGGSATVRSQGCNIGARINRNSVYMKYGTVSYSGNTTNESAINGSQIGTTLD